MKATKKNISKAILDRYGIVAELSKAEGFYYWIGESAAKFEESCTFCVDLNVNIDWFVSDFIGNYIQWVGPVNEIVSDAKIDGVIKSVYENQTDIIKSIMKLCSIDRFDVDVTYGNGMFYKEIEKPVYCFDLDGDLPNVTQCSSDNLPLPDGSVNSLMFDPPFLTYVRAAREGNGKMIMAKRFAGYWRYDELEFHYRASIKEAHRVLGKKGIMVIKCQDIIHNHKMHCTHVNIISDWAAEMFRLKDMFILPAKHRMPSPNRKGTQKHARIFHSYFLVLEVL